jgi:hypothetical protein
MMSEIEEEIKANDGTYPHKNGALSAAEVARRAGVHPTTLYTKKQRDGLGSEVKNWLDNLKCEKSIGSGRIRRSVVERMEDWKTQYENLAQSHRDTELALQQLEAELEDARRRLAAAETENQRLSILLAAASLEKVVPFPTKGG